jgi:hypothetical protein
MDILMFQRDRHSDLDLEVLDALVNSVQRIAPSGWTTLLTLVEHPALLQAVERFLQEAPTVQRRRAVGRHDG